MSDSESEVVCVCVGVPRGPNSQCFFASAQQAPPAQMLPCINALHSNATVSATSDFSQTYSVEGT